MGNDSISQRRNITFVTPSREALWQALATISGVMSRPMTLPFGITLLAAKSVSKPAPQPRSRTICPGSGSPRENGLPTPQNDSVNGGWQGIDLSRLVTQLLGALGTDWELPLLVGCSCDPTEAVDH